LWHTTTYDAIDGASAEALRVVAQQLAAAKLMGTGTVALSARSQLVLFPQGRITFGESTDSELTVTARTPDLTASGWSGQSHRDRAQLKPAQVVQEAIDFAQRGQHPVRVEPGKYTTILSHHAVGTLVDTATRGAWFDFETVGPFAYKDPKPGQPTLKLGERVFDPRLTLWTDPTDPEGGDFPFFEGDGYASGRETWIKDGVLRAVAYGVGEGIERHKTPVKNPLCVRMSGGTTPIDDMIATCERGIYVNRLSGVRIVDSPSGAMAGVTRDGCFLIKDGKIAHPIINLQFYQSPMFSFNNIEALGVPRRVAFGFAPNQRTLSRPANLLAEWPRPPVIVPPMKVHDFNFSALVDAV
jgi:predicted Zn-dependent protease